MASRKETRKNLINKILTTMKPHFYDSGFRKVLDPTKGIFGGTRPLKIYRSEKEVIFRTGFLLTNMVALSEDGPITDAYGGGCITQPFDSFPIEDLENLLRWCKRVIK